MGEFGEVQPMEQGAVCDGHADIVGTAVDYLCSPKQSVGVFGCHVDVAGVLVAGRTYMVVYELACVQSLGFGVVRSFGATARWGVFLVHTPIAC